MDLSGLKPSVDKKILILMAGLMWMGTGIMLLSLTVRWLAASPLKEQMLFFSAGFLIAMPIHHFGFLRIADKNLKRLMPVTGKKCLFSFMTWKSYLIIPVMASMGIALRHSGLPRQYLSVIYGGIGLALFLSGIRYLRFFLLLLAD
jgi:hypothetical protein